MGAVPRLDDPRLDDQGRRVVVSVLTSELIAAVGLHNLTPAPNGVEGDSALMRLINSLIALSERINKVDSARRWVYRLMNGELTTVDARRADELLFAAGRDCFALAWMIHIPTTYGSALEMATCYCAERGRPEAPDTIQGLADDLFNFARGIMREEEEHQAAQRAS